MLFTIPPESAVPGATETSTGSRTIPDVDIEIVNEAVLTAHGNRHDGRQPRGNPGDCVRTCCCRRL